MITKKRRSQKQERRVAKDFNADTVVASGAKWGAKGDVRNEEYLIECKTTEKDFYRLNAKTWEKIEREAIRDHLRIPLMVIDLKYGEKSYVVFRKEDFVLIGFPTVLTEREQKTFKIDFNTAGYTSLGDYIRVVVLRICGERVNVLCCVTKEEFEESYARRKLSWE